MLCKYINSTFEKDIGALELYKRLQKKSITVVKPNIKEINVKTHNLIVSLILIIFFTKVGVLS